MKFTFTCKKVDLNDSVKEYAEKKISKLDRYFKNEAEANVTFSVEKNNRCVVEVTIRGGNTLFRAQEENKEGNMRAAIDTAQEYIDRQIRKNKTRLEKRLRQDAFVRSVDEEEISSFVPDTEEEEFRIVRTKKFPIRPMSVEEAMKEVGAVVEGYYAALSGHELAKRSRVDMPILAQAYEVLVEGKDPSVAMKELMLRGKKGEIEDVGWM